jgi:hypothetical protein
MSWARALLCLMLASCDMGGNAVVVEPKLECLRRVMCRMVEWQLGIRYGPKLGGTHIDCRCVDQESP